MSAFFTSFSQEEKIMTSPVTEATYPGGHAEMIKFITNNLEIPAHFQGFGRIQLRFTVSETGEIKNIQVRRGIEECPECSDAAIEVLKKMPRWKPAFSSIENKEVASEYVLPIKFERKPEGK